MLPAPGVGREPDQGPRPPDRPRVVLVTGADRGIGLAVATLFARLGHRVFLSGLPGRAAIAVARLADAGPPIEPLDLDVTDAEAVRRAVRSIVERAGGIDILVNNAAAGYDPSATASTVDLDVVRRTLDVNLLGAWRMAQAVLPVMRGQGHGRIVNVSSDAGAFSAVARQRVDPGTPAYSVSKAGLNMLTVKLAADVAGTDILVNAIDPGWVRTDMGGPAAPRSPDEAAADIVWLATRPAGSPGGCSFRGREAADW